MTRKRWMWIGALAVAAVALVGGALALREPAAYANIATGFAAQQTCTCLHVSGRALESCMTDFPEDARSQFTVTQDGDRVRASAALGLFHAEAVYEEGFGCRPVD